MSRPKKHPLEFFLRFNVAKGNVHDACEHFAGRGEAQHDTAGCAVQGEMVLVRMYRAENFRLMLRSGETWHEIARVRPEDPALEALKESCAIKEYGPPDRVIEKQEKLEAERKAWQDKLAAYAESRKQTVREALERARARRERERMAG